MLLHLHVLHIPYFLIKSWCEVSNNIVLLCDQINLCTCNCKPQLIVKYIIKIRIIFLEKNILYYTKTFFGICSYYKLFHFMKISVNPFVILFLYIDIFCIFFWYFFAFSFRFPRIKRPHLVPSLATWGKCCSLSSPKWSLMPLTSPWSLRWVRCGIWQVSPQF